MFRRALFVLLLGTTIVTAARGQCLDWSRQFPLPGADQAVQAVAVHDDGSGPRLYIGGQFTRVGEVVAAHVARWNGVAWEQVGGGFTRSVQRFKVLDAGNGPELYATLSQPDPDYVYRWDGASWIPLAGVTGFYALTVFDDGSDVQLVERTEDPLGPVSGRPARRRGVPRYDECASSPPVRTGDPIPCRSRARSRHARRSCS